MSVSDNVRMALNKAGISQTALAKQWGTSPQAIYNKLNLERWSASDLARIAALTGGRLAFIYPDGQQILIGTEEKAEPEKTAEPAKPEKKNAQPKVKKEKKTKEPAKKVKPAKPRAKGKEKPKKEKAPEVHEEQISLFNL